jgi:hypothetical protein
MIEGRGEEGEGRNDGVVVAMKRYWATHTRSAAAVGSARVPLEPACSLVVALGVQGKRRYDRKQQGYGGQTKPILHKKVGHARQRGDSLMRLLGG